jgi:hypothetical protein
MTNQPTTQIPLMRPYWKAHGADAVAMWQFRAKGLVGKARTPSTWPVPLIPLG